MRKTVENREKINQTKDLSMKTKTSLSSGRWLRIIYFAVLAVIVFAPGSWAQYIDRPLDTLKVLDATAQPGDTAVWVSIYLRNSISVSGFTIRLFFDPNLLTPNEIGAGPDLVVAPTSRDTFFTDPSKAFGASRDSSFINFFAISYDTTLYTDTIASGTGPVLRIKFSVNPAITRDTSVVIGFSSDLPESYNLFIHATKTASDIYKPTLTNGVFFITAGGPPGNHAPVFDPLASQFTVTEGQNLSFVVGASDQDGDTVTLSADALPPNATFPTVKGDSIVSQTFSFTPDFTQGPGTVSVTFRAKDEKGVSTLRTVTITINEVPQDLLVVSKDKGGVPGSTGKLVPLILTNLQDVYGVQFTLHYDSEAVKVDSFVPAPRIAAFDLKSNLGDSSNQVTVLVFGLNNEIIPTGSDTILYIVLSVDSLASPGKKPLTLTNAWEAISTDPDIPAKELAVTNGFFTVDKFGDLNLDTLVNIGDVVSLIAYILGNESMNARQLEAADINRDGNVNVGDLVGMINTILGRPINAPIMKYREPLAYLHLEYDSLQPGSSGDINVWADLKTSVAGVQLKIKYDPDQLSFSSAELTQKSKNFNIHYNDDQKGNLVVLFYRYFGNPIAPDTGSILSLHMTAKSGFTMEKPIYLKEAILADPEAVVIPVDKGEVVLPKSFSLGQNYPNPFNPTTSIRFEIGTGGGTQQSVQTTLKVYNILGQVVKILVDEPKSPGIYYQTWDGKDEQGIKVSSGVYFYQLRAGGYNQTKKMVLLK
jgi:hypothetical protein